MYVYMYMYVYIYARAAASNIEVLHQFNITNVVNCTGYPLLFPPLLFSSLFLMLFRQTYACVSVNIYIYINVCVCVCVFRTEQTICHCITKEQAGSRFRFFFFFFCVIFFICSGYSFFMPFCVLVHRQNKPLSIYSWYYF